MTHREDWDGADVSPLLFTRDKDGGWHFYSELQPLRVSLPANGFTTALSRNHETGVVTISLDGKTVTYDRIAYDAAGNWICDLRIGSKRGIEG